MSAPKAAPITVGPSDGDNISIVGDTYRMLVTGRDTGGAFATMEFNVPPGGGPGPHSHPDFFESFYVVEGEVEVYSEAGSYTARKGAFVVIPKGGIVHNFKNKSDRLAVMICTVVPAGLEDFFKEAGQPIAAGTFLPPEKDDPKAIEKLTEAAERHGQQVFPPDYLEHK